MIHIDLQKWPHPNEEADFRISETILKIGVYNTDWRIYRVAKLKNHTYWSPEVAPSQWRSRFSNFRNYIEDWGILHGLANLQGGKTQNDRYWSPEEAQSQWRSRLSNFRNYVVRLGSPTLTGEFSGWQNWKIVHINLQKWPHPNEEAVSRISETMLLDWVLQYGPANLQYGRTKKSYILISRTCPIPMKKPIFEFQKVCC